MLCEICERFNPDDAKFCNNCGTPLQQLQQIINGEQFYGVFYPGGYGDGYTTSFGFRTTPEIAMEWQNSTAVLSINQSKTPHFLGLVSWMELLPADKGTYISSRYKVINWWELRWNGKSWEIGSELQSHPESLGLSNLE